MKCLRLVFTAYFAFSAAAAASSWFPGSKAVYNKWHQTELERWLADHDISYPKASDRKDLEALVENYWNDAVVQPYSRWNIAELSAYLREKGQDVQTAAEESKDNLLAQVKSNWYETEDAALQGWANAKDWILDTWSDSQLKAFCDKQGIPVPQPRQRDSLLQKARMGYETAAKQAGETAAYPGNWLYQSWSDSDFKAWLDKYGIPVPQPTTRDKLVAAVRRNSRLGFLKAKQQAASASASASASAQAAYATLTDSIIDAWSNSNLKDFCDKNNIPVPQGTKENELRALIRKHRASMMGDNMQAKASSAMGAATSNAKNEYAKATDSASHAADEAFNQAMSLWSESRLKAYLDARGIPVPHESSIDSLRATVRKHAHKAASGWQAWTFDDFSSDNLKAYLSSLGDDAAKKAAEKKDVTKEELAIAASSAYSSASSAGGSRFASVTSYLASATASAQQEVFKSWTESELKTYLDSYGIPVPQGSKLEDLKAMARKQYTYFKYGTSSPAGTVFAKLGAAASQGWRWAVGQLRLGEEAAQQKAKQVEKEL
ncbi:hypothetical protein E4U09_004443 [Claviceps aff. purpurea]|uniref:Brefeldin A resistance protein n=1 Tax=Claviceps aff. purpurea TaxID=1967640 RepID=A0A9P7QHY7_9HYPO|nr:hypothetical protein E4U12_008028 [Claviceps purpurea]KAG6290387.1 hypothetical protein E4U09_004443 [Claviceps aff. purpurea]KAG6125627.1 hypothetical protein E4U38_007504 [Claviceps purpurea]KAG6128915.1 hypothetical protein E4U28_008012 [Claviceps purpurea]KAG6148463.1 hypothetical protein E4U37_007397 [Claviceps purpurea]